MIRPSRRMKTTDMQIETRESRSAMLPPPTTIMSLPMHIHMDILIKLPIRPLIHCRSVCKQWRSLLIDPLFVKMQLSKARMSILYNSIQDPRKCKQLQLVETCLVDKVCYELKLTPRVNLPLSFDALPPVLLNSCNGLLLLGDHTSFEPVFVCNPILGEYIQLPKLPYNKRYMGAAIGFSYETNEYKVVRSFALGEHYGTEIYTLSERKWRTIGTTASYTGCPTEVSFNTFVNGAIHWISDHGYDDFIHSLHFGTETLQVVPPPSSYGQFHEDNKKTLRLGVLNDCLSIVSNFEASEIFEIWVMNNYGVQESWTKNITINMNIFEHLEEVFFEPMMIMESGEIAIIMNWRCVIIYNPHKREEYDLAFEVKSNEIFESIGHVPSFLSLGNVAKGKILKVRRGRA